MTILLCMASPKEVQLIEYAIKYTVEPVLTNTSYNGRNNKVPTQKYIDLFPMDFDLSVTFFNISETNSYSSPLYTTTEGVNNLILNSNK